MSGRGKQEAYDLFRRTAAKHMRDIPTTTVYHTLRVLSMMFPRKSSFHVYSAVDNGVKFLPGRLDLAWKVDARPDRTSVHVHAILFVNDVADVR